ncbi:MAG: CDP-diacylglycerol--glycerol-3-phosphate 3-phosphatidyltransferase [Ureaplasma sp.]|nr:CDP-diacylglycerol--glycerol-3-phosphate 3-phosphatidyltransferase [Ureaplasma sp.]MDE7221671.1 CDP-diacylglycerol--glycerol-3-phosphate 3-phosphatidyltransferase [Ureaplasma sp.]
MKVKFFQKQNIPNILTIFRIVLVPIIIVLLLIEPTAVVYNIQFNLNNQYGLIRISNFQIVAGILFILASITDFLDGYLARKWKVISTFGKFWDPLADKLLINCTLFCLASPQQNLVPIWIPIILLIRDFIIDGLRFYMLQKNIISAANIYGKVKTFVLIIAISFLLFFGGNLILVNSIYYWAIQNLLLYIAVILSIVSGLIYSLPVIYNILTRSKEKNETI